LGNWLSPFQAVHPSLFDYRDQYHMAYTIIFCHVNKSPLQINSPLWNHQPTH